MTGSTIEGIHRPLDNIINLLDWLVSTFAKTEPEPLRAIAYVPKRQWWHKCIRKWYYRKIRIANLKGIGTVRIRRFPPHFETLDLLSVLVELESMLKISLGSKEPPNMKATISKPTRGKKPISRDDLEQMRILRKHYMSAKSQCDFNEIDFLRTRGVSKAEVKNALANTKPSKEKRRDQKPVK